MKLQANSSFLRTTYSTESMPLHPSLNGIYSFIAGNSWGVDPDTGEQGVGLGPQEQFYGCADVRITGGSGSTTPHQATTTHPATGTQRVTTGPATGTQWTTTYPTTGPHRTTTRPGTTTRPATTTRSFTTTRRTTTLRSTTRPTPSSGKNCVPTEAYRGNFSPQMHLAATKPLVPIVSRKWRQSKIPSF